MGYFASFTNFCQSLVIHFSIHFVSLSLSLSLSLCRSVETFNLNLNINSTFKVQSCIAQGIISFFYPFKAHEDEMCLDLSDFGQIGYWSTRLPSVEREKGKTLVN